MDGGGGLVMVQHGATRTKSICAAAIQNPVHIAILLPWELVVRCAYLLLNSGCIYSTDRARPQRDGQAELACKLYLSLGRQSVAW